jgi:pantetheine-phosphate adenylyltransferase
MQRIAVFPGSFDPFTIGHEMIVRRGLKLFDKIIIGIGINPEKKYFFPLEKRKQWIEELYADQDKIEVKTYEMLTVDFCRTVGAQFILRGLRTSADFEYERLVGQVNRRLGKNTIETVYLLTLPEHTFISSSIVREIIKFKGDVTGFVPELIAKDIMQNWIDHDN